MGKILYTNQLHLLSFPENKTVVFTNGCFDLLHVGHVTYLKDAKKLGDILVVGLNSDESVKRLKGESRPINSQMDRALLLSALNSVDVIVIFDEDTPEKLIGEIKPDIHVKGGDYKEEDLPEAKIVKGYGGKVKIIPFLDDYSTSNIIDKIKRTDLL